MRLRVGNQTSFSASRVTEPFEFALANGFDAFEWFPDRRETGQGWDEGDLSAETRSWIAAEAKKHGISLSVHAPWSANLLQDSSQGSLLRARELASDIGAALLNVHFNAEGPVEAFADSLASLALTLSAGGIGLSVENTVHTGPEDFNRLFACLRARHIGALPGIGMCFDLGHANLYGPTRNDYLAYIDRLDTDLPIVHVHLHENYGDADSHLPLFTGPSLRDDSGIRGLLERLRRRRFSGSIIFEHWPQPPSLLLQARQRLMSLMEKGGQASDGGCGGSGGDLVSRIAEANRACLSWRNRLSWIREALTDPANPPDRETLAHLAVYLRFIGTGALPCAEDGGHYRPSHHARTSERIYRALLGLSGTATALLVRKILPWLPSFDSAFTRQEPLTRIRDIAHRNDIPRDLKAEIKQTLQNKLHRSAGPEDLVTSAALLERVTQPGAGYPPSFVAEFRLFHEELKEFFNAGSLEDRLERLAPRAGTALAEAIGSFLAEKRRDDGGAARAVETLALLTGLRAELCRSLPAGATPERLELHLADVGLEDYAFVLLSRIANSLEAAPSDLHRPDTLAAMRHAVANLRLSGIGDAECAAIEDELSAWSRVFDPCSTESALRLRATLGRCRRLSESYADLILSLLPPAVEKLGAALGVPEQARKVYAESDIRGHLVFQLGRLTAVIEKNLPGLKGRSPWDVIVPGALSGAVASLQSLSDPGPEGPLPLIALLKSASGDEEIPPRVGAILVAHETPRLSHLAIRARQAGVVFAACRSSECFSRVERLSGGCAAVHAAADEVRVERSSPGGWTAAAGPAAPAFVVPRAAPYGGRSLLDISDATPESCGAKAFSLRRLSEFAGRDGAGFLTLPASVVPFGVMEEALNRSPGLNREYRALLDQLSGDRAEVSEETLKRLQALIEGLAVPEEITLAVIKRLGTGAGVAVRSSANTEDLEGYSSAGLYDSLLNVPPSRLAGAVARVWSSLWTRRAAAGRSASRIAHGDVRMAVIIQEMASPDYAFVANTRNPFSGNPGEVYAEVVAGLGETLASARAAGTPYRLLYDKESGTTATLDLASFSTALYPCPGGGASEVTLAYSGVPLTTDEAFRTGLARRLGRAAVFLEKAFGLPQDIEGVVSGDDLYVVQSRPQQGIVR